jgi:hypothetical protein
MAGRILTPRQLGEYDVRAGFPKSPKVISEAIGYEEAESGGDVSNESQGPEGHIGAWSESPAFGSVADRLDPLNSSIAARKQYEKTGWEAWAPYEGAEAEGTGTDRAPKYVTAAEEALAAVAGKIGIPKGSWPPKEEASSPSSASGGASGVMKFLLTAALVLGGFALVGLGAMRSIGQRRSLEAHA